MKYIGMPMGMWVLFGKSFERNLVTEFGLDRNTAKTAAAKAKLRYKEIIAGLPEFEKEDRFKMNIVNCALMRELGLYDLVPAMCRMDYTMSEAGGASDFVREYTLASGGPYCDCGYKKKLDGNDNKGFWDRWAKRYDRTISMEKNTYARILHRMKKKLDRDMYVLELACGTGVLSVQLAANVKMLEATDFSEKMIEQAKQRKHSARLHFSVQDATALPYASETFDAVIISNALHIMPSPEKALAEIRRVLKPDGILIAPTFTAAGSVFGRLKIWLMELSGFQVFYKWNPQEYLNFLKGNGFTVIDRAVYGGALALTYAEAKVGDKKRKGVEI